MSTDTRTDGQRIDKWLWHARFARTRTAAQHLARSGHIRLNRIKVNTPSRAVRPGDVLTLALGRGVRIIEVRDIADRRGSADIARTLYIDRTPAASPDPAPVAPSDPAPGAGKRPDKRDRRRLARLKRAPRSD